MIECILKRRVLLLAFFAALALTTAPAQRLTWLGTLGGEDYEESVAGGVSADGSVVVGWAYNASRQMRAFRWTASGRMQDLGTLGGDESVAFGVSADGSVVVGRAENAGEQWRAFRWTASGGMQDLGTLGGEWSEAYGVSADGSVVVGWAYNASEQGRAFRWTASGRMQDLGTLGGDESVAFGVSADGSVVMGVAENASGQERAFRWTASGGMQDLGTLPDYDGSNALLRVSADGSVVVGRAENDSGQWRAFRWTASGGMQDLGTLGGEWSEAFGVSADGSVVVGRATNASRQMRAFRWTASGGMEDLNSTYASLLTNGSVLAAASAISPDRRYIVGWGYNAATRRLEAFLLEVQTTGVEETFGPRAVLLAQNVPNPFATSTTIRFVLPQWSHVKLTVVDVLGREVATLVDGELSAGEHTVVFNAGDLPSGVYFYRMQAGAVVQLRKMEVVR